MARLDAARRRAEALQQAVSRPATPPDRSSMAASGSTSAVSVGTDAVASSHSIPARPKQPAMANTLAMAARSPVQSIDAATAVPVQDPAAIRLASGSSQALARPQQQRHQLRPGMQASASSQPAQAPLAADTRHPQHAETSQPAGALLVDIPQHHQQSRPQPTVHAGTTSQPASTAQLGQAAGVKPEAVAAEGVVGDFLRTLQAAQQQHKQLQQQQRSSSPVGPSAPLGTFQPAPGYSASKHQNPSIACRSKGVTEVKWPCLLLVHPCIDECCCTCNKAGGTCSALAYVISLYSTTVHILMPPQLVALANVICMRSMTLTAQQQATTGREWWPAHSKV